MTAAECFRCGSKATKTFGNGYRYDDCISAVDGSPQDEDGSEETLEIAVSDSEDTASVPSAATGVPNLLAELGQVFVPIPPGEKGTDRPRTDETLFEADDPVLEAGHKTGSPTVATSRSSTPTNRMRWAS